MAREVRLTLEELKVCAAACHAVLQFPQTPEDMHYLITTHNKLVYMMGEPEYEHGTNSG